MGILVNTGFDVGSSNPIDNRTVKNTIAERDALVTDGLVYENLKVYCKDTQTEYRWTGTEWEEVGTGGTVDLSGYVKTYTTIEELGLTAPVTVGEIFNAMPNKTMAVIACEEIEENPRGDAIYVSDVPMGFGILTIKKNALGRFSIEYQNSLQGSACNVKKWIGTLKGIDGTGLYWKQLSTNVTYAYLSELGLDSTATLKDITRAMAYNSMIAFKVDPMANQSEYNNITQGTVTIYKIEDSRIQAIMTDKSTGRTWIGILGGENTIIGWQKLATETQVNELFQSVSNGKTLVANAITGKGVITATNATFATMATNIGKIQNVNSVTTYKEETKSSSTSMSSMTSMSFTFSARVLGVKKIIAPKDGLGSSTPCNVVAAMSNEAISISGRSVTLYVNGSGTWKVTALIEA